MKKTIALLIIIVAVILASIFALSQNEYTNEENGYVNQETDSVVSTEPIQVIETIQEPEPPSEPLQELPEDSLIKCDYEMIKVDQVYYVEHQQEYCHDETEMDEHGNNVTVGTECENIAWKETKTRLVDKKVCKPATKRIELNNQILEFEKLHQSCKVHEDYIECDETCYMKDGKRECGDGNGDGICQPGETCFIYPVTDEEIKEPKVKNGKLDVTFRYKENDFVEVRK